MDAFGASDGSHYGVPAYVGPSAVRYDPQAFSAAGLQVPAPNWTIDDFEHACAAVAAAMRGGKLAQLRAPLPPLTEVYQEKASRGTVAVPGQFHQPALWGAFVEGFGGTVSGGGQFDLTNSGATTGLQRMVDIATRYGASGSSAPTTPTFDGSTIWHPTTQTGWGRIGTYFGGGPFPYAMLFAPTAQLLGMFGTPLMGKAWEWARFPALPVHDVIPLQVTGFTVAPSAKGRWVDGTAPPTSPAQSLSAVAEFAVWWYQQYHTTPGLIGLPAPALADAALQQAYWNAAGQTGGYPAVGDWQHFAVVEAGWPFIPGAASYAAPSSSPATTSPVFGALTQAVTQRIPISQLLPQVTAQLNSMVATANITSATSGAGG